MAARLKASWPVWVTLAVTAAYILWRLAGSGWDALALAQLGTRFAQGDPGGSEGYDGQFAYYIAADPDPHSVSEHLDVPAYRYQRILYPLLVRLVSWGDVAIIPWALLAVNLLAHLAGTAAMARMLASAGLPAGYALMYGLWVGLVAAVGHDLYEPLAFALIVLGFLTRKQGRCVLSALCFGLALFAKETALLFWGAALLSDLLAGKERRVLYTHLGTGLAFALWQAWLWRTFGMPGLASGGAMATPFEWLPLMGLWRIGAVSLPVLGLYVLVFGPTVVLPAGWGGFASLRALKKRPWTLAALTLLAHSLVIFFLPFSTFREPLGLLRIATGLMLAVVVFALEQGLRKPLNYGMLWIALLSVLINQ